MLKKIIYFIFLAIFFSACLDRVESPKIQIESHNIIVKEAMKHLGKPYLYGATGPNKFDCSGFVYAVMRNLGISIPRTSFAQSQIAGKKLSRAELKEGDLIFLDTSLKGRVNHVGIYLGADKFIHASSGKAYSVTISSLNGWYQDKFRWGKRVQ